VPPNQTKTKQKSFLSPRCQVATSCSWKYFFLIETSLKGVFYSNKPKAVFYFYVATLSFLDIICLASVSCYSICFFSLEECKIFGEWEEHASFRMLVQERRHLIFLRIKGTGAISPARAFCTGEAASCMSAVGGAEPVGVWQCGLHLLNIEPMELCLIPCTHLA
jgi:hypothetical protein